MRKFLSAVLFFITCTLGAQNVSDLIISEALSSPDSTGILDGYGRRGGWVELFNKSTGTVSYGGCFLTDDRTNLKKSLIPKSDQRTKLGPRQSVVFYCSGNGADGTFYAGFKLEPGKTVYLVSNDGRTVIDSLAIPASLPAGRSIQKLAFDLRQQVFEPQADPAIPSPGILNGNQDSSTKAQIMAENDPHGLTLTVVSVAVVFTALAILWFLFWLLFDRRAKKKMAGQAGHDGTPTRHSRPDGTPTRHSRPDRESPDGEVAAAIALALDMEASGDDYAAIAAAVHLYLTEAIHDVEPGIVTIRRTESSAWNNKTLTFRQLPQHENL